MPKFFTADAATLRAEHFDRTITNRFLANHQSESERLEVKAKQNADALNHVARCDAYAGDSIDVESVSEESLAGEIGGERLTAQERHVEREERKAQDKAARKHLIKLQAMELSEHTAAMLNAKAAYPLQHSYRITRLCNGVTYEITNIKPDGVSRACVKAVQLGVPRSEDL
jgi:hypothetical protein